LETILSFLELTDLGLERRADLEPRHLASASISVLSIANVTGKKPEGAATQMLSPGFMHAIDQTSSFFPPPLKLNLTHFGSVKWNDQQEFKALATLATGGTSTETIAYDSVFFAKP
jgi:hypothetical protein